jgi:hypothetical protein
VKIACIKEGRWPGALVIVEETVSWGIKGYIPIPDGDDVGKAYVRIENGKFEIVGTIADKADDAIGRWLSAALEDPNVCAEMKADINAWFEAKRPGEAFAALTRR